MNGETDSGLAGQPSAALRRAVIDIGSNTVRLTVYEGEPPAYRCVINDKDSCGLGRDLARTGHLPPDGVARAMGAIGRLTARARSEGAAECVLLATAAVREAADGAAFCARVAAVFGLPVRVLDPGAEARLSALGVLAGFPDADGIVGDLGGGSLELAAISGGRCGPAVSLPLGHIRLFDASCGNLSAAGTLIGRALSEVSWLGQTRGRCFYAVGGSWRKLARRDIAGRSLPVDGHTMLRPEAEALARAVLADADPGRARGRTLPMAALLFLKLLAAGAPDRVVFSTRGLGDGWLVERLRTR